MENDSKEERDAVKNEAVLEFLEVTKLPNTTITINSDPENEKSSSSGNFTQIYPYS